MDIINEFKKHARGCSFNYAGGRDELGSASRHKERCLELYREAGELPAVVRREMREAAKGELWAEEFLRDIVTRVWCEENVQDVELTIRSLKEVIECTPAGEDPDKRLVMRLSHLGEIDWLRAWYKARRDAA
jgi:aspartate aminotransferase-like enzyme